MGAGALLLSAQPARAQEPPYFITYSHQMEEPGNLEFEFSPVAYATQRGGNSYTGYLVEFEYGATAWWTTELYLDAQTTRNDSTLFTGFRYENRFRPLMKEHWINPVLYVEFEDTNGADKDMIEVVGFDNESDYAERNAAVRGEKAREIETKLILSSYAKGWNFSENIIAEKNLSNEPWEFGYALGVSRPLKLAATPQPCNFCRENFTAGLEMYGGLGVSHDITLSGTSHYLAPVLRWDLPSGWALRVSPTFGLTDQSHQFLLRMGLSYELAGFGHKLARMFR
jgi:hypothetical protein